MPKCNYYGGHYLHIKCYHNVKIRWHIAKLSPVSHGLCLEHPPYQTFCLCQFQNLNQMVLMSEVGRYTSLVAVNTGLRIQHSRTPQIGIFMDLLFEQFFPEKNHHAKLWHLNTSSSFTLPLGVGGDIAISKPHKSYAMIAVAASASAHVTFAQGGRGRGD